MTKPTIYLAGPVAHVEENLTNALWQLRQRVDMGVSR